MPLLRYDYSVNANGLEKSIHKTGLLPAASYHDNVSVHRVAWHWHDEFELFHLLSGSIVFIIGTNQFCVEEGDALFINSGILHGAWDNHCPQCLYHSLVFHPRLVGGTSASVFWQKYVYPLMQNKALPFMIFHPEEGWQEDTIQLIERTWEQFLTREEGYEFSVRNNLSEAILLIHRHSHELLPGTRHRNLREEERIKTMLLFMEQNMKEQLTVADIAAAAYVSPTECTRCFKNFLHTTPIQYLRKLRLHNAENLLASTHMKIQEVGAASGFQDMSYFAQLFYKEYGMTPVMYRKHLKSLHSG